MTAAIIGEALEPQELAHLKKVLSSILPGTHEQQHAFLEAANRELDIYRKLRLPSAAEDERSRDRLEKLAESARQFSEAAAKIEDETAASLAISQWTLAGKRGTISSSRSVAILGDQVQSWGRAAEHLLERMSRRETSRPLKELTASLAKHYEVAFGQRPSTAREGTFAKTIREIFATAGISVEVTEHLLQTTFEKIRFAAPPPNAGRKRRIDY